MNSKAFAFVELLVVVALIAMLAIIATPRFKQAQLGSQVAQAQVRMRTAAKALESYACEHNGAYPWDGNGQVPSLPTNIYYGCDLPMTFGVGHLNSMLTTPIAYLSKEDMTDPFAQDPRIIAQGLTTLRYVNVDGTYLSSSDFGRKTSGDRLFALCGSWMLFSYGPDSMTGPMYDPSIPNAPYWALVRYDPTNGLASKGDIIVSQRSAFGKR